MASTPGSELTEIEVSSETRQKFDLAKKVMGLPDTPEGDALLMDLLVTNFERPVKTSEVKLNTLPKIL